MREGISAFGWLIFILLVLATAFSCWRFFNIGRRSRMPNSRKQVDIRPMRAKVLNMNPLSSRWNQQRVMKLRLLVFPEMGAAFMLDVQVSRLGEHMEPIHESPVLMLEFVPD